MTIALKPFILPAIKDRLYGIVVETATDLIVTTNEKGHIETCNQAITKMFGYAPEEILGRKLSELLNRPFVEDYLHLKASGGRRIEGVKKNGDVFPISITISEISYDGHQLFSGVVRDITQILNTEKELEKRTRELLSSNAELERFAAVVAHDLAAPARTMVSFSESLLRRWRGKLDESSEDMLGRMEANGKRMQSLISDLLALSKLDAVLVKLVPVSTKEIVSDLEKDLSALISESHAKLTVGDLPEVKSDRGQLRQLFQNFITNGIKFCDKRIIPTLHITAEDGGLTWIFCVSDNGIGIEAKYFDRIFESFQRLHGRSEYAGSGLGLSICKKIVERHGGRIWLESKAGIGSRFYFTLPK